MTPPELELQRSAEQAFICFRTLSTKPAQNITIQGKHHLQELVSVFADAAGAETIIAEKPKTLTPGDRKALTARAIVLRACEDFHALDPEPLAAITKRNGAPIKPNVQLIRLKCWANDLAQRRAIEPNDLYVLCVLLGLMANTAEEIRKELKIGSKNKTASA